MAGMGPPPKPASQRRRTNADSLSPTRVLPRSGRSGPPPEWPLGKGSAGEHRIWADLWATPQAAAWEEVAGIRSVARYVRLLVKAEKPNAPAAICGEVRQMEDRLGLTPMAMLRLRWTVESAEDAEPGLVIVPDVADRWKQAGAE